LYEQAGSQTLLQTQTSSLLRLGRKFDHRATPLSLFDSNYNKQLVANTQDYKDTKEAVTFDDKDIKGIEIPIDGDLYELIVNGSFELQTQEPQVTADSKPKERDDTSVEELDLKEPTLKGGQEIFLNIDIEFALDEQNAKKGKSMRKFKDAKIKRFKRIKPEPLHERKPSPIREQRKT